MFSLIITIISIALVAALALATLYYGGDAFNKGAAGAEASKLINEAQQVNGAVAMFKADVGTGSLKGVTLATVADLVTHEYLSAAPASFPGTTDVSGTTMTRVVDSLAVCEEVAKRAGQTDVNTAGGNGVFSCLSDGAATPAYTFSFKI